MGQYVQTGIGSCFLWQGSNKLGIDNSYIRSQFVICQRVFDVAIFFICNNRERSYFGTGAGSSWDTNKLCFLAQFREMVGTFTDIHKFQFQSVKGSIRMFIEEPHTFCSIHCGTAAQSDNNVWLECFHGSHAAHNGIDRRIGFYFGEDFSMAILLAFPEIIKDFLYIA